MSTNKLITILLILLFNSSEGACQFKSLKKWIKNEAIPTVTLERPLRIDPQRVTISHNGKKVFEATSKGEGTVYLDLGKVRLQTGKLNTRIQQTAAIMSGNTAVMSQVAYEQLQKQLEREGNKLLENGGISGAPPTNHQYMDDFGDREVIVYNQTGVPIKYMMNERFYEIPHNSGYKHQGKDFYLEFHNNPFSETDSNIMTRLSVRRTNLIILYCNDGRTITYEARNL
jgi:hypothetical protein